MIKVNPDWVPKDKFIFMVSGGVDSIAAAHWLKFNYKKDFTILHFNHKIQAINDFMHSTMYDFVKDFFDVHEYRVEVRLERDTPALFKDTSEDGLRKWRHHKLEGIGGNYVTAHHLNDAVENYLMNCLHGNPEHTPIPWNTYFMGNFTIYHPFLQTPKRDFINYAKENDLMKYVVEDPTNNNNQPKRNWVRNVIIPEINNRNMGIETVVRKKFYN